VLSICDAKRTARRPFAPIASISSIPLAMTVRHREMGLENELRWPSPHLLTPTPIFVAAGFRRFDRPKMGSGAIKASRLLECRRVSNVRGAWFVHFPVFLFPTRPFGGVYFGPFRIARARRDRPIGVNRVNLHGKDFPARAVRRRPGPTARRREYAVITRPPRRTWRPARPIGQSVRPMPAPEPRSGEK